MNSIKLVIFLISITCNLYAVEPDYFSPYKPHCKPCPEEFNPCSYLQVHGPNTISILARTEPFDRSKLISVDKYEATRTSEDLDRAHKENKERVKTLQAGEVIASPLPVIAPGPPLVPLTSESEPINNELEIDLEKLNPDGTVDTYSLPFSYPYDQATPPIVIPSHSLYEKR